MTAIIVQQSAAPQVVVLPPDAAASVVSQAASPHVLVSAPVAPKVVVVGIQGPPGKSALTIDPQAGNLLTTSAAGLFVNGALDLGTFN